MQIGLLCYVSIIVGQPEDKRWMPSKSILETKKTETPWTYSTPMSAPFLALGYRTITYLTFETRCRHWHILNIELFYIAKPLTES